MSTIPDRLPMRCFLGRWQVLLEEKNRWYVFRSKSDAKTFSQLKILEFKAMRGGYDCEELVADLEKLARLLQCGALGFNPRYFEQAAMNVRWRLAADQAKLK